MIFLEFSKQIVSRGLAPSEVCMADAPLHLDGKCGVSYRIVMLAEKVYEIRGNKIHYFKNRHGDFNDIDIIEDDDKIMLVLRATLI